MPSESVSRSVPVVPPPDGPRTNDLGLEQELLHLLRRQARDPLRGRRLGERPTSTAVKHCDERDTAIGLAILMDGLPSRQRIRASVYG